MNFKKLGTLALALLAVSPLALAAPSSQYAQNQYDSLKTPELEVSEFRAGSPLLGVNVTQKNREDDDSFCRKFSVVAPGAEPTYSCYSQVMTGNDAQAAYEASTNPETKIVFSENGLIQVGATRLEKEADSLLCVKTSAVVPNPVPSYSCYMVEVPVGSGVSVGN